MTETKTFTWSGSKHSLSTIRALRKTLYGWGATSTLRRKGSTFTLTIRAQNKGQLTMAEMLCNAKRIVEES